MSSNITSNITDVVYRKSDGQHFVRLMGHIVLEVPSNDAGVIFAGLLYEAVQMALKLSVEQGAEPAGVLRRVEGGANV